MAIIPLELVSDSRQLIHGNFGLQFNKDHVSLPNDFYTVLLLYNVKTLEDLVSYLLNFPSAIMKALKWEEVDFIDALEKFFTAVAKENEKRDVVDFLQYLKSPKGYGALDPKNK